MSILRQQKCHQDAGNGHRSTILIYNLHQPLPSPPAAVAPSPFAGKSTQLPCPFRHTPLWRQVRAELLFLFALSVQLHPTGRNGAQLYGGDGFGEGAVAVVERASQRLTMPEREHMGRPKRGCRSRSSTIGTATGYLQSPRSPSFKSTNGIFLSEQRSNASSYCSEHMSSSCCSSCTPFSWKDNCEGNAYPVALNSSRSSAHRQNKESLEARQKTIELAKLGVRNRRLRRMQSCQTPIHPITPGSLLDSICWSISEPTSSACIYTEFSVTEDDSEHNTSVFFDARCAGRDSDVSVDNFSRSLKESEKMEVIFRNHFLTILFPVDRFGELGPASRTFFSDGGFSILQVLDRVYNFYQENMSADEIAVAIHSDSRHADSLRSLYANKESIEHGFVPFKRIDFLGSRKCFEALKRVSGENNSNVYELLIRA